MNSNDNVTAGPSALKKLKLSIKNNNPLTQEELEMLLLASDFEYDDIGDQFFPEEHETSTDEDFDNIQDFVLQGQQGQSNDLEVNPEHNAVAAEGNNNEDTWTEDSSRISVWPVVKTSGLLVNIDENATLYDYFRLMLDDMDHKV